MFSAKLLCAKQCKTQSESYFVNMTVIKRKYPKVQKSNRRCQKVPKKKVKGKNESERNQPGSEENQTGSGLKCYFGPESDCKSNRKWSKVLFWTRKLTANQTESGLKCYFGPGSDCRSNRKWSKVLFRTRK